MFTVLFASMQYLEHGLGVCLCCPVSSFCVCALFYRDITLHLCLYFSGDYIWNCSVFIAFKSKCFNNKKNGNRPLFGYTNNQTRVIVAVVRHGMCCVLCRSH